jgi:phosphoribosyl 1,2-cyclic phosphodiesterase
MAAGFRAVRVWVLGSGSSGNAALVESEGERLLIDAGIGPQRSVEILRKMGVDLFPKSVLGVVVTHEHEDHSAKLEPLVRALRAPAYLHDGIVAKRVRDRFPVVRVAPGAAFEVGPFRVTARTIPHDAPQVALRVESGGRAFGYLTDMGHVPPSLPFFFEGCQTVLLEANYDAEMLALGPYPPRLQGRVSGRFGHLDNRDTGRLVAVLERLGTERVKLAHLSATNNTPQRALDTVRARAAKMQLDVIPNRGTAAFEVAPGRRKGVQLSLF